MTNDSDESWKFENYVEIVQELEGVYENGEPSRPWVFCPICEATELSKQPKMEAGSQETQAGTAHWEACPKCGFEISYETITHVMEMSIPDFEDLN